MNKIYLIVLTLITVLFDDISYAEGIYSLKQPSKDYVLITIPKSGSHLISKLIGSLSSNKQNSPNVIPEFGLDSMYFPPYANVTQELFDIYFPGNPKVSIQSHFNFSSLLMPFSEKHPEYMKIVMVRDPRDICISTLFFLQKVLDYYTGPNSSIEQRLTYIINGEGFFQNSAFNLRLNLQAAALWANDPLCLIITFEKLCGVMGGGSDLLQQQAILDVANHLGVQISEEHLDIVIKNLWGATPTFRNGKIGEWKKYFTKAHIDRFKELYGDLLIELEYEKDLNW